MAQDHVRDYVTLSDCYDIFNERLFKGELRGCVLTFEDNGPRNFGYFRKAGFIGRENGELRDEICLNPRHFLTNTGDLELLQTLAHEMAHQWQYQYGKPTTGYHDKEWGRKMLEIGLTPSNTGKPGGKMTGQQMADYPTEGGPFITLATALLSESKLIRWYKEAVVRRKAIELTVTPGADDAGEIVSITSAVSEAPEPKPQRTPSKLPYQCPACRSKVWGKPSLSLICGTCFDAGKDVIRLDCVA